MNRHDTSKSGLFLIELILSIFFFIIAMAVCLQLFVKAHTLSQDTIAMNHAILWTQNLAELFLGNDGDFSCVKQAYRDSDCVDSFAFDGTTKIRSMEDNPIFMGKFFFLSIINSSVISLMFLLNIFLDLLLMNHGIRGKSF